MPKRTMLMGVPGHVFEVPAPLTGASVSDNSDVDVRELANGGRKVYRKPVTYQTFNLNWKGTREELAPIRDLYNRRYGYPHFWMEPINAEPGGNLLPMRWSVGSQIGYMLNGIYSPRSGKVSASGDTWDLIQDPGWVTLFAADQISYSVSVPSPRTVIPVSPGETYFFAIECESSEDASEWSGVIVSGHNKVTGDWDYLNYFQNSTLESVEVLSKVSSYTYDFIGVGFDLTNYLGDSSNISYLSVKSMELSTTRFEESPLREIRPGSGFSAVIPTNTYDGTITSNKLNRVNYSLELSEVDVVV